MLNKRDKENQEFSKFRGDWGGRAQSARKDKTHAARKKQTKKKKNKKAKNKNKGVRVKGNREKWGKHHRRKGHVGVQEGAEGPGQRKNRPKKWVKKHSPFES